MATHTPPPYFPQASLSPPDKNRYRKFKFIIALIVLAILACVTGLGLGVWYLVRAVS